MIEQLPITDTLPASFFTLGKLPYAQLPFQPEEDPAVVTQLFALEAARNEIILFTDHGNVRLVGIFPENAAEAYFGFWETTARLAPNQEAFALLAAVARQRQRTSLIGPIHFNTFHRYRLRLTEQPSWGMFDREPVNPAYYPVFLKQLGFAPQATFESRLVCRESIPDVYRAKKQLLADLPLIPFDFIPLNPTTWQQYEIEIYRLVHDIFSANPAYKPISKDQFRLLYNATFAAKLCPYSSVLFRDQKSGKLVAMSFCYPDYRNLPNSTNPNFARDFTALPKKVLLVKSVGVHPAFRQRGLMSYLGAYAMASFRERYEEVIFCLMRSDNFSRQFSDGLPYELATYALFHKPLTELNSSDSSRLK